MSLDIFKYGVGWKGHFSLCFQHKQFLLVLEHLLCYNVCTKDIVQFLDFIKLINYLQHWTAKRLLEYMFEYKYCKNPLFKYLELLCPEINISSLSSTHWKRGPMQQQQQIRRDITPVIKTTCVCLWILSQNMNRQRNWWYAIECLGQKASAKCVVISGNVMYKIQRLRVYLARYTFFYH